MFETIRGHTILPSLLGSTPVVLDLGANHGSFSKIMSDRFGGTYYLAEANPELAQSLADEKRFHVIHCAVAASNGSVVLYLSPNDEASSVLFAGTGNGGEMTGRKVEVEARSIESILSDFGDPSPDLIKVDIEGMEGQALLNIPPAMLEKIGQITVEFHCDERFGPNLRPEARKTIRYLRDHGFLFLNFSGTTLMDVLFVNSRLHRIPYWKGRRWEWAGIRPPWLAKLKSFVPENLRLFLNQLIDRATGRKK